MEKRLVSVPQDALDARIEVVDNLYGKYDKANLINEDFTHYFEFSAMKREVYTEDF